MSEVTREEFESLKKIVYDLKKEKDDLKEEEKRNENKWKQINKIIEESRLRQYRMFGIPEANNEE